MKEIDESSSSDNTASEFTDKSSSRLVKEPESGRSYKRKGIPGKCASSMLTRGQRKSKSKLYKCTSLTTKLQERRQKE